MTVDGQVWYPTFYDLDTVLGIDNSGYLTIEPDVEIESGSYNTSNSNLWSKVWNYFNTELKEEWAKMRQGSFTLDNLMNYVYGEQISKIPAKMYNDDAQVKYLDFGSLYTYCCHGSKEHQIRRWLRERIAYVDSMLGYFTSQEDQVTIRMNKTGNVSFEVTPYIPLYFSVKWSNATGGTQTFKLKRGETKTFNYSSTTSTDQEVIIYHAKYIKRLDNLSNLNPSSCILSNAVKLTNVEIHSSELYNINVTNNKFLRSINLENCTALGTVTATGSSLNLSNCKYLRYCNVYNTHLTEVQLNTSGGSLTEIYYPKSIQSINLVKQRLLELIGLPYGENGKEIPTSLYTISIQECPSITKLNTSSDTTIASSFASMVYVNNLTIRNSLDLASLKFDGFHRLQNVTIENMYNLEEVGFNNLLPVGETSTIKYIGMSNCPKLGTIELNCTSNDYEITFADDAILNFGGLFKLNSITSNCVLKGIKTIVVPINLESMFFTNEYGSGYSTIENIWVSSQCNVDTQATTPIVTHVDSTYSGIDFLGMNLKNIDLGALVNIPKAINFKLSPTTVNPHFNLNRDGETYKYLQPVGTLDLSNYTESLAKFFDGVDLDKLEIICNNNLPQTDLSYCFYNSSFSTNDAINKLLTKVSSITNLDYCFYRTTINSVDILGDINMGESSSMNYTFAECPNIKELNSVVIPSNVTSVEGMFNKCPLTVINNMVVNVRGSISGLFKGCNKLTTINTLRIPNVTDVSNTFDGCTSLSSLSGFELPNSCTNVSNLFNGCYMLTELGMEFGANITAGDNWYPPNLETLHDTTISNDYVKLTNCTTLKTLNNVNISGGDLSDLFNGCTNLVNINRCTFNATSSLARAFKGCSKITINPITTIVDTVTDISEMYSGCTGITDISGMTFGRRITNATNWIPPGLTKANNVTIKNSVVKFTNCTSLTTCTNLDVSNISDISYLFSNCSSLTSDMAIPSNITNCTEAFKNCTSMTNIHANWNNTYTNDITSTDCYSGCTGIEYIDGESVVLYPGDKSIDYIPTEWGGYGLTGDYVSVFEINIPSDNYELRPFYWFNGFMYASDTAEDHRSEKNAIAWGDGTYYGSSDILSHTNYVSSKGGVGGSVAGPSHTYSKAGTYYIKGTFYSKGYGYHTTMQSCMVKCLKLASKSYYKRPIDNNDISKEFYSCPKLIYVNLSSYKNNALTTVANLFYNCSSLTLDNIAGLNELNLSNVTNMSNMFNGCTKITQLPITTIPDKVTGIDSIFKNTGITDISGLTIGSGVTSATDWITGSNITTANDVTIKSFINYLPAVVFTGWTSLVSAQNLKLVTSLASVNITDLFARCANLETVNFVNPPKLGYCNYAFTNTAIGKNTNGVIRLYEDLGLDSKTLNGAIGIGMFANNPYIKEFIFPNEELGGFYVQQLFDQSTNLKIVRNLKSTSLGNMFRFCKGATNVELINCYITHPFKDDGCSGITKLTNCTIPSNITNIDRFFTGMNIQNDIEIPPQVTSCVETFKNCTHMTNVHSNWNNTYDNTITSTECYAGCTGITHIDGENVIYNEYSEGLDEIPEAWGGYGFSVNNTAIVVVEIPSDALTFQFNDTYGGVSNILKTSWGDGTSDSNQKIHTYSTSGTYAIKVKYADATINTNQTILHGNYTPASGNSSLRSAGTKVVQVPIGTQIGMSHFREWSKLQTVHLDRAILNTPAYIFHNAPALERVDLTNCRINGVGKDTWLNSPKITTINIAGSTITNGEYLFADAKALTTILGLDTADFSSNYKITGMFANCKELLTVPPLSTLLASDAKPKDLWKVYLMCSKVTTIDISGVDFSEATRIRQMFAGGTALTNIIGFNEADLSKVTDLWNIFGDTPNLAIPIDLSNLNRSEPVYMAEAFYNCGVTELSGLSGIMLSAQKYNGTFQSMPNIKNLDVSGLDTSRVTGFGTAWTSYIYGCPNVETVDLSNLNLLGCGAEGAFYDLCRSMGKLKSLVSKNANVSNLTNLSTFLYDCPELVDLDLESWDISNVTAQGSFAGKSFKLTNFKSFKNINCDMNFSWFSLLTVESLMSIINALKTTTTTKKLTLGSTNLAKLTSAQIKIATDKGWTVV